MSPAERVRFPSSAGVFWATILILNILQRSGTSLVNSSGENYRQELAIADSDASRTPAELYPTGFFDSNIAISVGVIARGLWLLQSRNMRKGIHFRVFHIIVLRFSP